ncbi:alpha/beta fold hydrolase [Amycolatopsis sp. NPDC058986]|uniref:alpha/beta fold hydrolase n=1 Tax=unclassified Amycolatopsis TaxID=2618356 RepID=UPI0036702D9B
MTASAIYKSAEGGARIRDQYEALLDRWPVEAERRTVPTRLGETFVVVSGPADGPPVLALQGSGGNTAMWLPSIAGLAARLRVYAVDVPGEPGLSAVARPRLGSEAYAEWLDDVLDELGLPRATFLGASLGGWWSLDYAVRRPERVAGVALLNPSGVGARNTALLLKFVLLRLFGERGLRKAMTLAAGELPKGPPTADEVALVEFMLGTFKHYKPRMEPIPTFTDEQLRSLVMPVLAVLGARDGMIDQRETAARLRAALPDADVRLLEDAGHFLPGMVEAVVNFADTPRATR